MARKRYSDEDVLRLLREGEVFLAHGLDGVSACQKAGLSDATCCTWRKTSGGVGRTPLAEKTENKEPQSRDRSERRGRMLKRIVADLELDKLTLEETVDDRKPKA
ncbi:MAG: transposase [Pseudomonadota bacterium]